MVQSGVRMRTRLAAADSGSKRRGVPVLAKSVGLAGGALLALILLVASAAAGDLQLKIPRRTKPTPVQQLNQQGVKYLVKNDITGAKRVFYKAYLLDPDDPFTLNNLGYVAELDGEIERAQKFYELAAANSSNATVALSSNPELEGRHVSQVAGNAVTPKWPAPPVQSSRLASGDAPGACLSSTSSGIGIATGPSVQTSAQCTGSAGYSRRSTAR